jgi:hypothetical protein
MIQKYVKKPIIVEAIQWNGRNTEDILKFCKVAEATLFDITIKTLEGNMKAEIGDYIIKGIKGEFYPCKADIFEETYDQVISENDNFK